MVVDELMMRHLSTELMAAEHHHGLLNFDERVLMISAVFFC